jgi:glycosyltransferase involved in cell wall biosynthesis
MQVTMLSFWQDKCGVTEYTRSLVEGLRHFAKVRIVPTDAELDQVIARRTAEEMNEGDIAHIQHNTDYFGGWRNPLKNYYLLALIKHVKVPLIISVHDLPSRLPFQKRGTLFKTLAYNGLIAPLVNWSSYGEFITGGFLKAADHIIVHSSNNKHILLSKKITDEKITVLYPGVPDLAAANVSVREIYGLADYQIITMFGFIAPYKGYETALQALKLLPKDVALLIAGGIRGEYFKPYLEELNRSIEALGLGDRVVVTGYLDEGMAGAALMASDIILLTHRPSSITGGTSYGLSYGLAAKRPVITSDLPFFCEIEQKYSAVKTFKEGNCQALADAIVEVLNRNGKEGIGVEEYCETWSWGNVAERTYQIYCDVLKRRRACPPASLQFAPPCLTKEINKYEN